MWQLTDVARCQARRLPKKNTYWAHSMGP